jgi:hypothetical protein
VDSVEERCPLDILLYFQFVRIALFLFAYITQSFGYFTSHLARSFCSRVSQSMRKGRNTPKNHSSGGITASPAQQQQINRTRSKLPTKRKKQRQEANITSTASTTVPPQADYEQLIVHMPRNSQPPRDTNRGGMRGGMRGGHRGRGGLGHSTRAKGGGLIVQSWDVANVSRLFDAGRSIEYE